MAFKLSKADIKRRDEIAADMQNASADLKDAIEAFNEAMQAAWKAVEDAQSAYNDKLSVARDFIETFVDECRSEAADKSEKWQEGEAAERVESWLGELEAIDLDDIELEAPEPLAEPDLAHSDELAEMPENADQTNAW